MARVELSFFTVGNRSVEGGTMPVPRGTGLRTERLEVGPEGTTSAAVADGEDVAFVRIWSDGDVWVATGREPGAVHAPQDAIVPGIRVVAGLPVDLALEDGDRVAVAEIA